MNVSHRLGKWYEINKRILPWREHLNPYYIWLSEIILQQTRVSQGMSYYLKFIKKFPSIESLASASIEEVLVQWQGLGYYTRARNLHKAAKILIEKYKGKFPEEYDSIRELPGVGDYTAAAIASLAFNKPYPAIDGNVYRVLARFFGIYSPVNQAKSKPDFYKVAKELLDTKNPGRHNQAMIELGALICLPKNAKCIECPISEACYAFQKRTVNELPVRQKKLNTVNRYFYYLVIRWDKKYYIKQRKQNDIWALLYEFPLIETKKAIDLNELINSDKWKEVFQTKNPEIKKITKEYIHKLSHQTLHTWFIEIEADSPLPLKSLLVSVIQLEKYPFPRLIDRYLKDGRINQ